MMPGDSQSRTVAIAADASVGNCQNCSVLQQNLTEYVSSFLALKQKITVSDDTIKLQQQLEKLQIRLGTLETKTADYERVQAELEEKKHALKAHVELSKEMENLKQRNDKTLAENKELSDQLKIVKEITETQTFENSQLKREKAVVENDLLQTQASLKKYQTQAEKVDVLMKEKSKMTNIKDSLENKVRLLEDSVCKQNQQISRLTKEKNLLERNIDDLQVRLMKLERERSKEYRSTNTQTSEPMEPKIDKDKFKTLLENLWACIQPEQKQTNNQLHFTDSGFKHASLSSPPSKSDFHEKERTLPASSRINESSSSHTALKLSPQTQNGIEDQASIQCLKGRKRTKSKSPKKCKRSPKKEKNESVPDMNNLEISIEEILGLFTPVPPCLSPLQDLVESMDTDDEEKETHPTLPEDCSPPDQEESLHVATPSSSQKKVTVFPAEDDMDSPTDIKQDNGHVEIETGATNLAPTVLSCQMKDETNAVNENGFPQKVKVTELEPAFVQSGSTTEPSASSSNVTVVIDSVSLPTETLTLPKSDANHTSGTGIENSAEEAMQDQFESAIEMDVDTSTSSGTDAGTVTLDDGGSLKGSDSTLISSEAFAAPLATLSTFGNDVKDTNPPKTESTSDDEKSEDASAIKTQKSTNDGDPFVSNESIEQKTEIEISTAALAKEDQNATQESGEDDEKAFPILPNGDKTMSPKKSPPLKEEQEHDQAAVATPSENDNIKDTMEIRMMDDHGSSLPDSPEKQTLDCKSLKENGHSPCWQLSPCSSPVKLQIVESDTNPSQLETDTDSECLSNNKRRVPVPDLEKETTCERNIVQDFPQDSGDSGSAASFTPNAAPAHKQSNGLESGTEECEKQGSDSERGKKESTTTITVSMNQILSEVGSPLPPLLTPLYTPPKKCASINPRHAIGKLLFPSPMDTSNSPVTPVQAHMTPNGQQQSSSSLNSPIPPNGVPSSPLQFGSATPKHAVPVPGRLPVTAANSSQSSSPSPPQQENSMRILDSMYPELSAGARTLSILRGNVNLTVGSSDGGSSPIAADGQVSSFKTLKSTSTAFTKTDVRGEKRSADSLLQPVSKCLRLDSSDDVASKHVPPPSSTNEGNASSSQTPNVKQTKNDPTSVSVESDQRTTRNFIVDSLKKIEDQCFDLMPVISSHVFVGNLPKKPVLRDEEKEVLSEIRFSSSHVADKMMSTILNKLKAGKQELTGNSMQALCRVYTGICRQKGDYEKARLLAYSVLTEDFPECSQLVLFMVTTWPTVLSHSSSLCQAIHTVTKLKATDELLSCLSPVLGWEKNPPCDIDHLISRTLSEIQSGENMSFTKHSRYGDDLDTVAWERIFTLHLLCSHKKWRWTYDHLLGKELWPMMDSWVSQPRDQQQPLSDVTVATVLRLIGYLCQLGIKEKSTASVGIVANVINTFGRHGQTEGVPWEVQLAAVYCIFDVSPCNPKHALNALAEWRRETTQKVPPAATSYMTQLASICRQVKS
ncbi:unnamed protein product [Ophioblennius macclurei]